MDTCTHEWLASMGGCTHCACPPCSPFISPRNLLPGFNPGSTTAITKGVGSFSKVAAAVAVNTTIGEGNSSGMAFGICTEQQLVGKDVPYLPPPSWSVLPVLPLRACPSSLPRRRCLGHPGHPVHCYGLPVLHPGELRLWCSGCSAWGSHVLARHAVLEHAVLGCHLAASSHSTFLPQPSLRPTQPNPTQPPTPQGVVVWDLIIAGNGALAGLVAITGA